MQFPRIPNMVEEFNSVGRDFLKYFLRNDNRFKAIWEIIVNGISDELKMTYKREHFLF